MFVLYTVHGHPTELRGPVPRTDHGCVSCDCGSGVDQHQLMFIGVSAIATRFGAGWTQAYREIKFSGYLQSNEDVLEFGNRDRI